MFKFAFFHLLYFLCNFDHFRDMRESKGTKVKKQLNFILSPYFNVSKFKIGPHVNFIFLESKLDWTQIMHLITSWVVQTWWGVYDIDDCCHGAMHLADIGQANLQNLCIDGRSAGGYSTLASLTFKSVFKAGIAYVHVYLNCLVHGSIYVLSSDCYNIVYRWGVSDIDDCCYGALYLGDIGRADEKKLCIDGGSAGGFTTLACLTFKSVFKAGRNFNTMITIHVCAQVSCKVVKYLFSVS